MMANLLAGFDGLFKIELIKVFKKAFIIFIVLKFIFDLKFDFFNFIPKRTSLTGRCWSMAKF